jgi:uncharacterized repeat protein (TIGR03803 family)
MKTQFPPLHHENRTSEMTEPVHGGKPDLPLVYRVSSFILHPSSLPIRLLFLVALVLPALGTQAGVLLTDLYSFPTINNGTEYPGSPLPNGLVQGSDGFFYGTTSQGSQDSDGAVFKINTNGAYTNLYSFGFTDGVSPLAGLVQGGDGHFYGTTYYGGTNVGANGDGYGTVFKMSTNGALTSLYSFCLACVENGLFRNLD